MTEGSKAECQHCGQDLEGQGLTHECPKLPSDERKAVAYLVEMMAELLESQLPLFQEASQVAATEMERAAFGRLLKVGAGLAKGMRKDAEQHRKPRKVLASEAEVKAFLRGKLNGRAR